MQLEDKVKVPLTEEEKSKWWQKEKAYGDRVSKHTLNQQNAFAIIIGQCMQCPQDKMHDNPQWETVNKNKKLFELYSLIGRVVSKQIVDKYPPTNCSIAGSNDNETAKQPVQCAVVREVEHSCEPSGVCWSAT